MSLVYLTKYLKICLQVWPGLLKWTKDTAGGDGCELMAVSVLAERASASQKVAAFFRKTSTGKSLLYRYLHLFPASPYL